MTSRFRFNFLVLILTIFSLVFSLSKGSTPIPISELFATDNLIFLKLRFPRTVTAFVTGALLSLSGALMQLLLQNPLADPYVLGVSGGAALATLLMMLFGLGEYGLLGGAWMGSLSSVLLILLFARKHHFQPPILLLAGIALACAFSAAISCVLLISPDTTLHNMLFWLSGDLNGSPFPWIGIIVLLSGLLICLLLSPGLNLLSRGERESQALGLAIKKYRIVLYLLSSLFAATAVTLAGSIGFIGLIIPHITRILVGFDHKKVLPIAALLGGSLLTIADTFARSLLAPQQLPVGILMVLIGVPSFIWLLQK